MRPRLTRLAAGLVFGTALLTACGGGSTNGGEGQKTLRSGDIAFEVDFLGAEKETGEVRRGGTVTNPPSGHSWWAFELRVKNVSAKELLSASTPDVAVACGDDDAADVEAVNNPGFVMGKAPYATGTLDNGASNTGVVPLAVPDGTTDCRFIVRMDPLHDPDEPEILEFKFDTEG